MKTKTLSTYAVFSKLYDKKKNVYDVIREFIFAFLAEKHLYCFQLSEFVSELNNFYNFNLPQAVIKTSLKHIEFICVDNGEYKVDYNGFPQKNESLFSQQEDTEKLFSLLIKYIEEEKKKQLSKEETKLVLNDLYSFLQRNSCNSENMSLISTFALAHSENSFVVDTLNEIKEGVIIYDGITSDLAFEKNDINKHGSWKTKLTIYLDLEILFHIAGYNGEYFKQQADDFLSFVREINRTNNYIQLRYFYEIEKEINGFFRVAEDIVDNGKLEDGKIAMKSITSGCKTRSDVIEKKASFNLLLDRLQIKVDDYQDYYSERNFKYNIENQNNEIPPFLNYINILRKDVNNRKLADVGYIFVTGTSDILKKSFELRKENECTRATSLDYMIEHFWFILNKGFGAGRKLKSFDVINKSKIVLSGLITSSVSAKYDELNKRIQDGEIDIEDAKSIVAELRDTARMPEDIKKEDLNFILNFLNESDINVALEEKAIKEQKLENVIKENKEKDSIIENQNTKINSQDDELRLLRKKNAELEHKERERIEYKNKIWEIIKIVCRFIVFGVFFFLFIKFLYPKIKNALPAFANAIAWLVSILSFFGINFQTIKTFFQRKLKNKRL